MPRFHLCFLPVSAYFLPVSAYFLPEPVCFLPEPVYFLPEPVYFLPGLVSATNPGAKENQSIITGNQIDFNGEFAKTDVKTKLQKPTKIKIQKKKGKLLLSWKKIAKASGYEIQIAANKRFKKAVKKKTKKPVLQMKKWKKKICFLRVRAYHPAVNSI